MDAGAAARGARRRRGRRGRAVRGDRRRARSSTARRRCSCSPTRTIPQQSSDMRARLLAARTHAPAAGPRRQGRDRVERAGDRRAGRGRRRCSTAATSTRRVACAELLLDLHVVDGRLRRTSRDGVVGDGARRGRGLRRPRRRPARAAPGHGRAALARRGRRAARRRARALRRRRRRLLRHRRRRRAAGAPPAATRPTTPTPSGCERAGRRAARRTRR